MTKPHTLTPRRLEALATLRELTQETGSAVHYPFVAARLRVSAWTAYGFLRELEGMGMVVRQYGPSDEVAGGRPRILFAPAAPAAAPAEPERLRDVYQTFAAITDEAAAARSFLAGASADLTYQFGFWLSRLEAAGRAAAEAGRAVLEGGALPAAKIQTLSAMGLGSVLARLGNSGLSGRMTAAAARLGVLVEDAARVSDSSLAGLVDAARLLDPALANPRRATT